MREIITIIKGNYRKGKSAYISVFILVFILSLCMTAVLTVYTNSAKRVKKAMEETGLGDMLSMIDCNRLNEDNITMDELLRELDACDSVERADVIPTVFLNRCDIKENTSVYNCLALDYGSEYVRYNIYDENNRLIENPVFEDGCVIVPISFRGLYGCKPGDILYIGNENLKIPFRVAAYFEDPYMGASIIGTKTILFGGEDMELLAEYAKQEESLMMEGFLLSIFKRDTVGSNVEFERQLNAETSYSWYAWFSLLRSQAYSYMLMLTNIFSALLAAFVICLIIVTMIVIGHNITSNIEQDCVDIGILKAVGLSNGRMKLAFFLGYLAVCLLGIFVGVPASVPFIALINDVMRPVTGLYVENDPVLSKALLFLLAVLIVVFSFVFIKLRKLAAITPVTAMNDGNRSVYFSDVLKLPISKRLLDISLAWRQLVSVKKQYIGTVVITALLTLFMALISSLCVWLGNDGKALHDMYSTVSYDLGMWYASPEIQAEVEAMMQEDTDFETFHFTDTYLLMDGIEIHCNIVDSSDYFTMIYDGRECRYDNEILITEFVRENYDLGLGDKVVLSYRGVSGEYIVSGINQTSNDAGKDITMTMEGYLRLTGGEKETLGTAYVLDKPEKAELLKERITELYTADEVVVSGVRDEIMNIIVESVNMLAALLYLLTAMFIAVTINMICGRVFVRERRDHGIYKALGFTSGRLRLQFAVRFMLVSVIGSVLGILLAVCFSDRIMEGVFRSFGIYNFEAVISPASALVPIGFMTALYFVFSYLASARMRRVQPRILIME